MTSMISNLDKVSIFSLDYHKYTQTTSYQFECVVETSKSMIEGKIVYQFVDACELVYKYTDGVFAPLNDQFSIEYAITLCTYPSSFDSKEIDDFVTSMISFRDELWSLLRPYINETIIDHGEYAIFIINTTIVVSTQKAAHAQDRFY